ADPVDDLRRDLVHAMRVARVRGGGLQDLLLGFGPVSPLALRDDGAAAPLLHWPPPCRVWHRGASRYDRAMCRVLAYLGEPISLGHALFETDSSLVRQSYSPRMMNTFLNLAGFGMVAWEPNSARAQEPFVYRTTSLPAFDPNLRALARKLEPT